MKEGVNLEENLFFKNLGFVSMIYSFEDQSKVK